MPAPYSCSAAIEDLSKAIGKREQSKFRRALLERGLAYKGQGLLDEARADFERILAVNEEVGSDPAITERVQAELKGLP